MRVDWSVSIEIEEENLEIKSLAMNNLFHLEGKQKEKQYNPIRNPLTTKPS